MAVRDTGSRKVTKIRDEQTFACVGLISTVSVRKQRKETDLLTFLHGRKVSFNSETKVYSRRILLFKTVIHKFLRLQLILLSCSKRQH